MCRTSSILASILCLLAPASFCYADRVNLRLERGPYTFPEPGKPGVPAKVQQVDDFPNYLGDKWTIELDDSYNGGTAHVGAFLERDKDSGAPPSLHVLVTASVPATPDDLQATLASFAGSARVHYYDTLRVNLFENPGLAAIRPVIRHHAYLKSQNPPNFVAGKPFVRLQADIGWGSVGNVSTTTRRWDNFFFYPESGDPVPWQPGSLYEQDVEFDFVAPAPVGIFNNDIEISMTWTANFSIGQSVGVGAREAIIDGSNTFEILGLIPYDALGNILPANSLVLTSANGWNYPILGTPVPEPATALPLLTAALLLFPRRRIRPH